MSTTAHVKFRDKELNVRTDSKTLWRQDFSGRGVGAKFYTEPRLGDWKTALTNMKARFAEVDMHHATA